MITASIVTYHNNKVELKEAIDSFLNTGLTIKLYISDNSSNDELKELCFDPRIEYIFNNSNNGFGAGHNIAIKKAIKEGSKYHLIINPDTFYEIGNLEKMVDFMEKNKDVGLIMPKILYPNGDLQYVCKLLPTPFNLFARAFLPKWKCFENINEAFEMRFTEYKETMLVPYISGCFMVFRTDIFSEIGFFDESIFMYLEETDISRRVIETGYKTVMYSEAIVYHHWAKGNHRNKKLKIINIQSGIYYFGKYGWFFDKKRRIINREIKKNWKYIASEGKP